MDNDSEISISASLRPDRLFTPLAMVNPALSKSETNIPEKIKPPTLVSKASACVSIRVVHIRGMHTR